MPALRHRDRRAEHRATTTACCTGVPDARREDTAPGRPQGRRPDRARQHAGVVRRRAGGRRRHDRVRRPARGPPRPGRLAARARPRLHARPARARRRSRRASTTWPARRSRTSSSTSTSSCPATRTAWSPPCASAGSLERRWSRRWRRRALRAAARARARAAARLVGAEGQARLHAVAAVEGARACAMRLRPRRPPGPGGARRSRSGLCDALMANWHFVTPRLVRAVLEAPAASSTCGRSTTRDHIGRFEALGVDRRDHERPAAVRDSSDLADRRAVAVRVRPGGRAVPGLGDLAAACGRCWPGSPT